MSQPSNQSLMGVNDDTEMAQFTYPKVVANTDLDKRWHVEFYIIDSTGQRTRHRIRNSSEYPSGINRINTYEARMKAANNLVGELAAKLQMGWRPAIGFDSPRTHFEITVDFALNQVMDMKRAYLGGDSYASFKGHIKQFIRWLVENSLSGLHPTQVTPVIIVRYLNSLSNKGLSPRTRNNYLVDISSAFAYMSTIDATWCPINPATKVTKLPNRSNRHELWTEPRLEKLSTYLRTHDNNLWRFCLTFMMLGIRPKEAVKIQIRQINLNERLFILPASHEKGSSRKAKRIFKPLHAMLSELNLHNYPEYYYLFTTKGLPGAVPTTRDYFTKQFTKAKRKIGYTTGTMYSLKHTFIVELFKAGEPISDIMKITGHKTLAALQAYIQQYLDEPAKEVNISIKF